MAAETIVQRQVRLQHISERLKERLRSGEETSQLLRSLVPPLLSQQKRYTDLSVKKGEVADSDRDLGHYAPAPSVGHMNA